ncbi:hypothetical protein FG386_000828 [Cryptosporidium ryanae]|uniref:uncharacterized protein n=1 Tax=Cryptosporidium ryanae TaxID=515981 RepID=UPI00351A7227|nr:hypothetical protein FG386_000828 [Cryptosporidium ryanae]
MIEFDRLMKLEIHELLTCYFVLSASMVILACLFRGVSLLTIHGKLNSGACLQADGVTVVDTLTNGISKLTVNKTLFSHFYFVGTFTTLCYIYKNQTNYRAILFLLHYYKSKVTLLYLTSGGEKKS